jgi:NAD(P)-dependent dehydrogenase (short-subunit alcohol dehydrogenase family)
MAELKGRAAIVTGGTRGIGRAIADALADAGMRVAVAARTQADCDRTAQALTERTGTAAIGVACDVRSADDCARLVAVAVAAFGGLDILINNAGIGAFAPAGEMDVATWDAVVGTNLNSLFYCTHPALPHLRKGSEPWIINIGSLAGKNAFPGGAAYNATKFGLIGFSEALMQDVRYDGIRVSYIMPGSVATDFSRPSGRSQERWRVQPEDIAQIVMDLLAFPARTLPSRVEVRPSMPPRK